MGKRSRAKGVTGAALRAARGAAQQRDEEAHAIAREVYATCVTSRPHLGNAPLWAVGPLSYVAAGMAQLIAKANPEVPEEEVEDVAAYLAGYLTNFVLKGVGDFDVEHYRQWRAEVGPDPSDVRESG